MRHSVVLIAHSEGDFAEAHKFCEESLLTCREIGDQEGLSWTLYRMGVLAESQGDNIRAMELSEQALQIGKVMKSKKLVAVSLQEVGALSCISGDYEKSRSCFEEAIEINRKMGNQAGVAESMRALGWSARFQGDYPKAQSVYSESLQLSGRTRHKGGVARCLIQVAQLRVAQGSPEKFAYLLGMAEGIEPNIQKTLIPPFRIETENFIKTARVELGDEAYFAAWEAGRQTSMLDAIAYALKELGQ